MQTVSYYREDIDYSNDVCSLRVPLQVNCCGIAAINHPFTTQNPQGRNDYYLLYLAEGRLDFSAGAACAALTSGNLVLLSPRTPFTYTLQAGSMAYYWVHFTGSLCAKILEECGLPVCTILNPGLDAQAQDILGSLHRAFILRADCFEVEASSLLGVLLSRFSRLLQSRASSPSRLQTSLEYMHRHYTESPSVQELAALEFLSPSRFSALFRRLMGVSPQQYLISLRMQSARELIRSTDMPIKQVAAAVGYADQLYFSRLFHHIFGCSPSSYRAGSAR